MNIHSRQWTDSTAMAYTSVTDTSGETHGRAALPRADEILDHCKEAFSRKGFDGASMQDLSRAAGMSASNFYRYFDSKDAIIVALVEREMGEIEQHFEQLIRADNLHDTLLRTLAGYLSRQKHHADGAIWAEIQAAAPRRPAVADALRRMEDRVSAHLLSLFARLSGLPRDEAVARYSAHAAMIFLLSRGALMTRCGVTPPPDAEQAERLLALVLRSAGQLIDEIATSR